MTDHHDGWLISSAELARLLGKSVGWLYRHRAALEAAGMPAPHPAFKRPLMWSRGAVRFWIDGRHQQVADQHAADQERAGARARMAARARSLAGKGA